MGSVHGIQCLPCIVPRMDSPADAGSRMGILRRLLWMFFRTGSGVPFHRYQAPGEGVRSSPGKYTPGGRQITRLTDLALVLD